MSLNIERDGATDIAIAERGRDAAGNALFSERRLYMQLQAFGHCSDPGTIAAELAESEFPAVLYADLHDPEGIALLLWSTEADFFVDQARSFLQKSAFRELERRPSLTMFGRTYTLGYESDLDETLIARPIRKATDPATPWAIWYPLRRAGAFESLSAKEQRTILMEHGGIGRAFGRAGLGTDIRLACHGLDRHDNDFVIGLIGADLAPLSKIVERMRKTKQTSQYLASLGPFFVGKALWQSEKTTL